MRLEGTAFENSDTCKGVVFGVNDAPLDMAEIEISGRYPERGWALNHEAHEMVRVLRGVGMLALRSNAELMLGEGDVVHVPAGQQFAWSGDMTILMACSPPFTPEQYEIKEADDEI